jgi:5-formyltetrahydrofolate cyclo-ligase
MRLSIQPTMLSDQSGALREEKAAVRRRARGVLKAVGWEARQRFSTEAVSLLLERPEFRVAKVILGYMALPDELDLARAYEWAWASGKTVLLPRYVPASGEAEGGYCAAVADPGFLSHLPGQFGIPEPPASAPTVPLNALDFVLVPGLGFDFGGRRLGRGKGFYDRLLAQASGVKCGVALDAQVFERLPSEPHDIAMNFVLTPTRWLAAQADSRERSTGS